MSRVQMCRGTLAPCAADDPAASLKPLSGDLRGMPVSACRDLARQRHAEGLYDADTLACFRQALRLGRSPADLVAYLSFRRDRGHPLNRRHVPFLRRAMRWLGPRAWLEAWGLLAESAQVLPRLPMHFWPLAAHLSVFSPPLAARRGGSAPDAFGRGLLALVQTQEAQRAAFARFLASQARVCVVGNAGQLQGADLGAQVDAHDCVIRFNQYTSPHSMQKDRGSKADVWVRAPGFSPQEICFSGAWGVVTGPDLRYRLTDWRLFRPLIEANVPLLTVPLPVWRELVQMLSAPPSAGLLFLAWLRMLRKEGLQGISLVGFQRGPHRGAGYHHALPKQAPGRRHNWHRERELLAEWASCDGAFWLGE